MPKREQVRPLDWRGRLSREGRQLHEWYERQLQEAGVIPPPPLEFEYAACLPCDESIGEP